MSIDDKLDSNFSLVSYADDVLLLPKASTSNAKIIIEMLNQFKDRSGLFINVSKSHIMYSPLLQSWKRKDISSILNFKKCVDWWTHLRIPMNGSRIPASGFNKIISKIDSNLSSWKSKLLSFTGRITLIK